MQEIVLQIRHEHRKRVFAMEQRKRNDLALGSFLRPANGWSATLPKPERDQISEAVKEQIKAGERFLRNAAKSGLKQGDWRGVPQPPELGIFGDIILASIEGRAPIDRIEADATAEMERLSLTLPIWPFCAAIQGFGPLALAIIVAELAGPNGETFSDYASKSKVWKRLGLAVFDDQAQGRIPFGLVGEARKNAWIARGYNPMRRSRIWTVGKSLVLGNGDGKYRSVYLARKKYEADRAAKRGIIVAPAAKIPKEKTANYISLGHIDRRSQRYMEKMLTRDLWNAWRGGTGGLPRFITESPLDGARPS